MIFFPEMLKTYEECKMKYFYKYEKKISMPKNDYIFEKGKNIHALASYFAKGYDISKFENILKGEELQYWNYLKSTEYFQMKFLKSEYQLSSKIGDDWISGRLDALVCEKDNYYILDYKTGSTVKDAQNDYQTIIYLMCADKFIKNYKNLQFVYINLKNNTEDVVTFSENLRKQYEERLKTAIKSIKESKFSEVDLLRNIKCKCEYYKFCQKVCYD